MTIFHLREMILLKLKDLWSTFENFMIDRIKKIYRQVINEVV